MVFAYLWLLRGPLAAWERRPLCWGAGRFPGGGDPPGFQPLSPRRPTARAESREEERRCRDVVPGGVVPRPMPPEARRAAVAPRPRVPHWAHEAPPAAGTRVRRRSRSCSLSQQAGGTERGGFGARDRGVHMPLPPLLSPRLYYGIGQAPQHLSAALRREAAGSPAHRERPSAARGAFGTCTRSQGATRERGKRGAVVGGEGEWSGRRGVYPLAPPPGRACGEFLPAGLMRGYYPRDELMPEARGVFVRFRVPGAPVADSPELCAVAISTHSWVNSRSGFAAHGPTERDGSQRRPSGAKSLGCLTSAFPNLASPRPLPSSPPDPPSPLRGAERVAGSPSPPLF